MAASRMRNASGHNYWNSSFIMPWLWGRYHVPQNAFLVVNTLISFTCHTTQLHLSYRLGLGHTLTLSVTLRVMVNLVEFPTCSCSVSSFDS